MSADLPLPSSPRRGFALIAWLVIACVVAFILYRYTVYPPAKDRASLLVTIRGQARAYVGLTTLNFPGNKKEDVYRQAEKTLDRGIFDQRVRFVPLAGELAGPFTALGAIHQIRDDELDDADDDLLALLERLYTGYVEDPDSSVLSETEQQTLRDRLGWFGDLALAPEEGDEEARAEVLAPARRTVFANLTFTALAILGGVVGFVLLLVLVILSIMGWLSWQVPADSGHGGIYAETFALYMVIYLAIGLGVGYLHIPQSLKLAMNLLAMLLSLGALAWPVLRGIPWGQVCQDIGLTRGKWPWLEPFLGFAGYLAAIPLLFLAVLFILAVSAIRRYYFGGPDPLAPGVGPTHPIIGIALSSNVWLWLQVAFLACVMAPLVEEIMFRGVLYRHLRDVSRGLGRVWATLFAALVSAFVFAVIHPQGWLGVPVLMALALIFAILREWRGTLIPSMVGHGVNNGVSTLFLLAAMS